MSAFWLKRPVARRQWLAMALSYAGVVLVFAHDLSFGGGGEVLLGSLFVFASATSYSVYLICSGELIKRVGATRLVAYAMLVSCVACIAQFFAVHPATMLLQPAGVYGYSLIHATLNTVAPVFMLMWAVARIGAPTASLLGMVGPVSVLFGGLVPGRADHRVADGGHRPGAGRRAGADGRRQASALNSDFVLSALFPHASLA